MPDSCIYCESTTKLNTRLDLTFDDGQRVSVFICDDHAEEASIKAAKDLYLKRKAKIDELLEQAKKLGLEFVQSGSSNIIIAKQAPQAQQVKQVSQPVDQLEQMDAAAIDSSVFDKKNNRKIVSRGGSFGGESVESHTQHDLSDMEKQVPQEVLHGKVVVGVAEGRSGIPITIPKKRVDGLGTTTINIINTDDAALQKRFKQIADRSRDGDGGPDFRNNYDVHDCPLCRGKASVRERGKDIVCPKCGGKGIIG